MAVILEVKSGPLVGKRIAVVGGQIVTVGRTSKANFAIPHDTFMSGVHFAIEYGPAGCVLTDRKSSNGTFVNGERVVQASLNNGDEVRSGQTEFVIRVVREPTLLPRANRSAQAGQSAAIPEKPTERTNPPNRSEYQSQPNPKAFASRPVARPGSSTKPSGKPVLTIGGWTLSQVPEEWIVQDSFGIQCGRSDAFPSSAVVTDEPIGNAVSLQQYVEAQLVVLRQYLREPRIEAMLSPKIVGAEDIGAISIQFSSKAGQALVYRRIYVRVGRMIGLLTLTTSLDELKRVQPEFDAIIAGAKYDPGTTPKK